MRRWARRRKTSTARRAPSPKRLAALQGEARVAVLEVRGQPGGSAIPVVPLYGSLLYRVMKDAGVHENDHRTDRPLYRTQVYSGKPQRLDEGAAHSHGRRRVDTSHSGRGRSAAGRSSAPRTSQRWADLDGFRADFLKIFGFGFDGVDYDEDLDPGARRALGMMRIGIAWSRSPTLYAAIRRARR